MEQLLHIVSYIAEFLGDGKYVCIKNILEK